MAKKKRQQRSNYEGQEEMCAALWDFAREVEGMKGDTSFSDRGHAITDEQHAAIVRAMERISAGYGYRLLSIQ